MGNLDACSASGPGQKPDALALMGVRLLRIRGNKLAVIDEAKRLRAVAALQIERT